MWSLQGDMDICVLTRKKEDELRSGSDGSNKACLNCLLYKFID